MNSFYVSATFECKNPFQNIFRVELPHTLHLPDDDWQVALCDIKFPHEFHTNTSEYWSDSVSRVRKRRLDTVNSMIKKIQRKLPNANFAVVNHRVEVETNNPIRIGEKLASYLLLSDREILISQKLKGSYFAEGVPILRILCPQLIIPRIFGQDYLPILRHVNFPTNKFHLHLQYHQCLRINNLRDFDIVISALDGHPIGMTLGVFTITLHFRKLYKFD